MSYLIVEPQLPWDHDSREEKNYHFILSLLLLCGLIFSWLVASSVLRDKPHRTQAEIPERFVKLVLEQKRKIVTPPPPKIVEVTKPEKKPEKKNKPKKVQPKEILTPKQKAISKVKPKGNRKDAREKAKKSLAVFDVFADLKDASTSKKIANQNNMSADIGTAKSVKRDMIVNQAKKSSGGVKVAKASTNIAGAGLEGGGSRQVSSNLAAAKIKQSGSARGGGLSERPAENIEKYMDRHKNSFFTLYNRALRKTPSMHGEIIFNIIILPDGRVKKVAIISSELNNPILERKLLTQIRSIRFTTMNVVTWDDNYRISFIPS